MDAAGPGQAAGERGAGGAKQRRTQDVAGDVISPYAGMQAWLTADVLPSQGELWLARHLQGRKAASTNAAAVGGSPLRPSMEVKEPRSTDQLQDVSGISKQGTNGVGSSCEGGEALKLGGREASKSAPLPVGGNNGTASDQQRDADSASEAAVRTDAHAVLDGQSAPQSLAGGLFDAESSDSDDELALADVALAGHGGAPAPPTPKAHPTTPPVATLSPPRRRGRRRVGGGATGYRHREVLPMFEEVWGVIAAKDSTLADLQAAWKDMHCPVECCAALGPQETSHPLLHAVHQGRPEMVHWLLLQGLRPDCTGAVRPYSGDNLLGQGMDNEHRQPLDLARQLRSLGTKPAAMLQVLDMLETALAAQDLGKSYADMVGEDDTREVVDTPVESAEGTPPEGGAPSLLQVVSGADAQPADPAPPLSEHERALLDANSAHHEHGEFYHPPEVSERFAEVVAAAQEDDAAGVRAALVADTGLAAAAWDQDADGTNHPVLHAVQHCSEDALAALLQARLPVHVRGTVHPLPSDDCRPGELKRITPEGLARLMIGKLRVACNTKARLRFERVLGLILRAASEQASPDFQAPTPTPLQTAEAVEPVATSPPQATGQSPVDALAQLRQQVAALDATEGAPAVAPVRSRSSGAVDKLQKRRQAKEARRARRAEKRRREAASDSDEEVVGSHRLQPQRRRLPSSGSSQASEESSGGEEYTGLGGRVVQADAHPEYAMRVGSPVPRRPAEGAASDAGSSGDSSAMEGGIYDEVAPDDLFSEEEEDFVPAPQQPLRHIQTQLPLQPSAADSHGTSRPPALALGDSRDSESPRTEGTSSRRVQGSILRVPAARKRSRAKARHPAPTPRRHLTARSLRHPAPRQGGPPAKRRPRPPVSGPGSAPFSGGVGISIAALPDVGATATAAVAQHAQRVVASKSAAGGAQTPPSLDVRDSPGRGAGLVWDDEVSAALRHQSSVRQTALLSQLQQQEADSATATVAVTAALAVSAPGPSATPSSQLRSDQTTTKVLHTQGPVPDVVGALLERHNLLWERRRSFSSRLAAEVKRAADTRQNPTPAQQLVTASESGAPAATTPLLRTGVASSPIPRVVSLADPRSSVVLALLAQQGAPTGQAAPALHPHLLRVLAGRAPHRELLALVTAPRSEAASTLSTTSEVPLVEVEASTQTPSVPPPVAAAPRGERDTGATQPAAKAAAAAAAPDTMAKAIALLSTPPPVLPSTGLAFPRPMVVLPHPRVPVGAVSLQPHSSWCARASLARAAFASPTDLAAWAEASGVALQGAVSVDGDSTGRLDLHVDKRCLSVYGRELPVQGLSAADASAAGVHLVATLHKCCRQAREAECCAALGIAACRATADPRAWTQAATASGVPPLGLLCSQEIGVPSELANAIAAAAQRGAAALDALRVAVDLLAALVWSQRRSRSAVSAEEFVTDLAAALHDMVLEQGLVAPLCLLPASPEAAAAGPQLHSYSAHAGAALLAGWLACLQDWEGGPIMRQASTWCLRFLLTAARTEPGSLGTSPELALTLRHATLDAPCTVWSPLLSLVAASGVVAGDELVSSLHAAATAAQPLPLTATASTATFWSAGVAEASEPARSDKEDEPEARELLWEVASGLFLSRACGIECLSPPSTLLLLSAWAEAHRGCIVTERWTGQQPMPQEVLRLDAARRGADTPLPDIATSTAAVLTARRLHAVRALLHGTLHFLAASALQRELQGEGTSLGSAQDASARELAEQSEPSQLTEAGGEDALGGIKHAGLALLLAAHMQREDVCTDVAGHLLDTPGGTLLLAGGLAVAEYDPFLAECIEATRQALAAERGDAEARSDAAFATNPMWGVLQGTQGALKRPLSRVWSEHRAALQAASQLQVARFSPEELLALWTTRALQGTLELTLHAVAAATTVALPAAAVVRAGRQVLSTLASFLVGCQAAEVDIAFCMRVTALPRGRGEAREWGCLPSVAPMPLTGAQSVRYASQLPVHLGSPDSMQVLQAGSVAHATEVLGHQRDVLPEALSLGQWCALLMAGCVDALGSLAAATGASPGLRRQVTGRLQTLLSTWNGKSLVCGGSLFKDGAVLPHDAMSSRLSTPSLWLTHLLRCSPPVPMPRLVPGLCAIRISGGALSALAPLAGCLGRAGRAAFQELCSWTGAKCAELAASSLQEAVAHCRQEGPPTPLGFLADGILPALQRVWGESQTQVDGAWAAFYKAAQRMLALLVDGSNISLGAFTSLAATLHGAQSTLDRMPGHADACVQATLQWLRSASVCDARGEITKAGLARTAPRTQLFANPGASDDAAVAKLNGVASSSRLLKGHGVVPVLSPLLLTEAAGSKLLLALRALQLAVRTLRVVLDGANACMLTVTQALAGMWCAPLPDVAQPHQAQFLANALLQAAGSSPTLFPDVWPRPVLQGGEEAGTLLHCAVSGSALDLATLRCPPGLSGTAGQAPFATSILPTPALLAPRCREVDAVFPCRMAARMLRFSAGLASRLHGQGRVRDASGRAMRRLVTDEMWLQPKDPEARKAIQVLVDGLRTRFRHRSTTVHNARLWTRSLVLLPRVSLRCERLRHAAWSAAVSSLKPLASLLCTADLTCAGASSQHLSVREAILATWPEPAPAPDSEEFDAGLLALLEQVEGGEEQHTPASALSHSLTFAAQSRAAAVFAGGGVFARSLRVRPHVLGFLSTLPIPPLDPACGPTDTPCQAAGAALDSAVKAGTPVLCLLEGPLVQAAWYIGRAQRRWLSRQEGPAPAHTFAAAVQQGVSLSPAVGLSPMDTAECLRLALPVLDRQPVLCKAAASAVCSLHAVAAAWAAMWRGKEEVTVAHFMTRYAVLPNSPQNLAQRLGPSCAQDGPASPPAQPSARSVWRCIQHCAQWEWCRGQGEHLTREGAYLHAAPTMQSLALPQAIARSVAGGVLWPALLSLSLTYLPQPGSPNRMAGKWKQVADRQQGLDSVLSTLRLTWTVQQTGIPACFPSLMQALKALLPEAQYGQRVREWAYASCPPSFDASLAL